MADVSSDLKNWSTTAASNSPSGSTTIGTNLDDNLREIQKVVRQDLASVGADIASAATTDVGAVAGYKHKITGTTTITSLGTVSAGITKVLQFAGSLTLTHNATSLILPGGTNITTQAGDVGVFLSEGSGNWRCITFTGSGVDINGLTEDTAPAASTDYLVSYDASAGTNKKVLIGAAATDTLATPQNSTSGTQIDFTSIPSWVKTITVMLVGVSTNGTSQLILQIGDSGGPETSGYSGASCLMGAAAEAIPSNGFAISPSTVIASNVFHGQLTLNLENSSSNTWVCSGAISRTDNNGLILTSGSKSLSATLDRVRITTAGGANTFDAGAVNIKYQ